MGGGHEIWSNANGGFGLFVNALFQIEGLCGPELQPYIFYFQFIVFLFPIYIQFFLTKSTIKKTTKIKKKAFGSREF